MRVPGRRDFFRELWEIDGWFLGGCEIFSQSHPINRLFMSLLLSVSVLAFAASFVAKLLSDAYLHERVAIAGSFLGLYPSRNPGIAFGIRLPVIFQEALIVAALIGVVMLASQARTRMSRAGYGLIIGGALGNAIDRVRDGYVTDFFQVGTFPIFNVADSCITIGVMVLLVELLLAHIPKSGRS